MQDMSIMFCDRDEGSAPPAYSAGTVVFVVRRPNFLAFNCPPLPHVSPNLYAKILSAAANFTSYSIPINCATAKDGQDTFTLFCTLSSKFHL